MPRVSNGADTGPLARVALELEHKFIRARPVRPSILNLEPIEAILVA